MTPSWTCSKLGYLLLRLRAPGILEEGRNCSPRGWRTGVAIDEVTVRANELLQFGLDALQNAGNIKRERKQEAQEALYVIGLSLGLPVPVQARAARGTHESGKGAC